MALDRGSSTTALIPFLGPWLSALLRSSGNYRPIDRALGAAATLGLSIAILRLVAQALKQRGDEKKSTLWILQGVLWGLFASTESEAPSLEKVIHRGSCHCRAIEFELLAPQTLHANEGPGKIRYPHIRTEDSNFRFVSGTERLQIYYVSVPAIGEGVQPIMAAHTFCSQCGVNILHAPNGKSNLLDVNINCLDVRGKVKMTYKRDDLNSGVPVEGQWNNDEEEDTKNASMWGTSDEEDVFIPFPKLEATPLRQQSDKHPALVSPGTPSTVATNGTDSILSTLRSRSFALEQDSAASEDSDGLPSNPLKSLPLLNTNLESTGSSTQSQSTTPMMRDQLKYYMSKHLSSRPPPPSTAPTVNETASNDEV